MTYHKQKLINISTYIERFCKENKEGYVTYETAREGFEQLGYHVPKDATLARELRECAKIGLLGRGRKGKEAIFFPMVTESTNIGDDIDV